MSTRQGTDGTVGQRTQEAADMAMGKVSTERDGASPGLPIVAVSGEVDLALAPSMEEQIASALDQSHAVIVDLGAATFIDSVALGTLISARQRCESSGETLYLIVSDHRVKRVFELTGLESAFSMFETRQALMDHVAATGSQA
jgi:anti-sigma B factor antagonist